MSNADQTQGKDLSVSNMKGMFSLGGQTTSLTKTYMYDWETDETQASASFGGKAASGAFKVTVHDTLGQQVFSNTFDNGNEGYHDQKKRGALGTWKIKVAFEESTGNGGLSISRP